jgi:hypothetical protein
VLGYGVRVDGLPGSWPNRGPVTPRGELTFRSSPGELPTASDPWISQTEETFTIGWPSWAEYQVDRSRVDTTIGPITERDAALGFVFSVLPLVLPLFDLEPLHGSVVRTGAGALLVLGKAGAGKSTTGLALQRAGFGYVADDAAAIDSDGFVWPGPPIAAARQTREAVETYDGKAVVTIQEIAAEPLPVTAAVILGPADGATLVIDDLDPAEATAALLSQVRAPWALPEVRVALQLQVVARVASARVGVVRSDRSLHSPEDVAGAIADWAAR